MREGAPSGALRVGRIGLDGAARARGLRDRVADRARQETRGAPAARRGSRRDRRSSPIACAMSVSLGRLQAPARGRRGRARRCRRGGRARRRSADRIPACLAGAPRPPRLPASNSAICCAASQRLKGSGSRPIRKSRSSGERSGVDVHGRGELRGRARGSGRARTPSKTISSRLLVRWITPSATSPLAFEKLRSWPSGPTRPKAIGMCIGCFGRRSGVSGMSCFSVERQPLLLRLVAMRDGDRRRAGLAVPECELA